MKMIWCGLKIKQNCPVLVNQFHRNFHSKTPSCRKFKSVFRDIKWCFNASWGLKGLKSYLATATQNFKWVKIFALDLFNLPPNICESLCSNTHFIPSYSDSIGQSNGQKWLYVVVRNYGLRHRPKTCLVLRRCRCIHSLYIYSVFNKAPMGALLNTKYIYRLCYKVQNVM